MSLEYIIARYKAFKIILKEVDRGDCDPLFVNMIEEYVSFKHNRIIKIHSILKRYDENKLIDVIRKVFYSAEDCTEKEKTYANSQKIVAYVKMRIQT